MQYIRLVPSGIRGNEPELWKKGAIVLTFEEYISLLVTSTVLQNYTAFGWGQNRYVAVDEDPAAMLQTFKAALPKQAVS